MTHLCKKHILTLICGLLIINNSNASKHPADDEGCPPSKRVKSAPVEYIRPAEYTREAVDNTVARVAKETYERMRLEGKFAFGSKSGGFRTDAKSWEIGIESVKTVTGKERGNTLKKKIGIPMSVALEDLFENNTRVECRIASFIVIAKCVQTLLGEKLFDKYYEVLEKSNQIELGASIKDVFPNMVCSISGGHILSSGKGMFGYIANVANYPDIHPKGSSRGENVVVVDIIDQRPIFAYFLGEPDSTGEAIIEKLWNDLIKDPNTTDKIILKKLKMYSDRDYFEAKRDEEQKKWDKQIFFIEFLTINAILSSPLVDDSV